LKTVQQALASILILAMAFPAWGASEVVGTAVQTQAATVHQSALVAGSTVYSGDAISASANGRAEVALPGGGRVDVLSNSTVRMDRNSDEVQFSIERGSASFQTRPDSPVEAVLTDAHVRAPKGGSALGIVGMESPDSVLVVAKIGELEVVTDHDSKSILIPEGSAARITLVSDDPPQAGAPQTGVQPAGRRRRRLAVVLLLGGGGVAAGAILATTGGSSSSAPVSPSAP
jgi:ferric-dicitrate binding protein FerR (iron transport regulator)